MAVTLEEVTKLYVATFNRAPDAAGITYWVNSGMPIESIAQSFFDQPETQNLYPSGTANSSFVTSVYANLFNRTPDTDGLNYWVQELDSGTISKQNFILAVINGALSDDATILTNKQTVGLDFVAKGLESVDLAQYVMEEINAVATSVEAATALIAEAVAPVGDVTSEMLEGRTFYTYDSDLEDSNYSQGYDALWKHTFSNGEITSERYTALYGTSDWVLGDTDTTHFTITNGHIVNAGSDAEETWSVTLSLLSSTEAEMVWWDRGTSTNTQGTPSTEDDTTDTWDDVMVWMSTQPSARTQEQMEALGVVVNTDTTIPAYNIRFNDASNISITSTEDGTAVLQGGAFSNSIMLTANVQTALGTSAQATVTQTQLSISDQAGNTGQYSSNIYLGTTGDDTITAANQADILFGFEGADTFIVKTGSSGMTTIAGYTEGDHITTANGGTLQLWSTPVDGWTITDGIAVKNEASTASDPVTEFITAFKTSNQPTNAVVALNLNGKFYVYGSGESSDTSDNIVLRVTGITHTDLHVDEQGIYFM